MTENKLISELERLREQADTAEEQESAMKALSKCAELLGKLSGIDLLKYGAEAADTYYTLGDMLTNDAGDIEGGINAVKMSVLILCRLALEDEKYFDDAASQCEELTAFLEDAKAPDSRKFMRYSRKLNSFDRTSAAKELIAMLSE